MRRKEMNKTEQSNNENTSLTVNKEEKIKLSTDPNVPVTTLYEGLELEETFKKLTIDYVIFKVADVSISYYYIEAKRWKFFF